MFLKSIELFGFKSFAERSRIEFTDGISALIGPNGCGKSNVVDAVKWVLGEQATRSLRAERMEDVIFNGTEARKALNVAEVSLTIENDGVLPLEFSEIEIKRRLFRDGDSEYFINGAPVRLKELRELFYDTGIGKSAYSIMEQGKIDQILSSRPEERRALFEEAAGITRFKVRAREADRKLERTEQNMHEVASVLQEVERSYSTLAEQAERTTEYRSLRERAFELEVALQLDRLVTTQERFQRVEARVAKRTERRDALRATIDAINERLESDLDRVSGMETRLVDVQKQLYGLELEKGARGEQIAIVREQRSQVDERIAQEHRRLETLARREEERREQRATEQSNLEEAQRQVRDAAETLSAIEERIERSVARRREATDAVKAAEVRIGEIRRAIEHLRVELRTVTDELVEALDRRLRESGYSAAERARAATAFHDARARMSVILAGRMDALGDRARAGGDLGPELARAFDDLSEAWRAVEEGADRVLASFPDLFDELLAPEGTMSRKRELDGRVEALDGEEVDLRKKIDAWRHEIATLGETIDGERSRAEQMRIHTARLEARVVQIEQTIAAVTREIDDIGRQRTEVDGAIATEQKRARMLDAQIAELSRQQDELVVREQALIGELQRLEQEIASDNARLKSEEQELKKSMQELAAEQSRVEEAQVELAERRTEIRAIYEAFSERHGRDLREFEQTASQTGAGADDSAALRDELANVRARLRELGSVNLMAVEEFAEVKARHDFLSAQLTDLKDARADLEKVTEQIRRESQELFAATYARIRKNFHTVFRRLFGGGRAELRLTDPDDILASGVDILVQPPGKRLENIALLSGGERSMTAVALLFATAMVRPAPFTLLDEIDAALDEHNVSRFVDMVHEFAGQSQFVIITHNKRTVAGANTLLGVTMEESGVSRIVSVRVDALSEGGVAG